MKFPKIFKERESSQAAIERVDQEEAQLRQLVADLMQGKVTQAEYDAQSKNLCRIDLRAIAQALQQ
jgi:hypothetical protein